MKKIIMFLMLFVLMLVSVNAQIFPTSFSVTTGTLTSGNLSCLESIGTSCLMITEQSQAPGFTVNFNYTNITTIDTLNIVYYKVGAGVHTVDFEIYDYMFDLWFDVDQFALIPDEVIAVIGYPTPAERFIDNGLVQTRLIHEDAGNPSNSIDIYSSFIEPIEIAEGESCPTTELQNKNNFLLLAVVGFLIIFGLLSKSNIIGAFGGIGLILWSGTMIGCNNSLGVLFFISGILIMAYFGLKND